MKGWFQEPWKHSLAARGVHTADRKYRLKNREWRSKMFYADKAVPVMINDEKFELLTEEEIKLLEKDHPEMRIERLSRNQAEDAMEKGYMSKKFFSEKVVGGRADGMPDWKFDPDQLWRGTKHEMEHTNDPEVAEEVAKDHLVEDSDYYDKLERMESGGSFSLRDVSASHAERESAIKSVLGRAGVEDHHLHAHRLAKQEQEIENLDR